MITLHPRYFTDSSGNKFVALSSQEFDQLLDQLEELEDIRLFEQAREDTDPPIPVDQAFQELERARQKN